MRSVYFRVPGEPVAKERPRTFVDGTGKTRTITPRKTQAAEQMIGYEFRRQYPGFGEPIPHPVSVRLVFHTMSKAKDADNLTKTCLDALQGVVFANDRQVDEIWAKVIRGKGNPETIIEVSWREGAA